MTDQLEHRLREALSQRAAERDPDSIARLRAVDYHPRRSRLRRLPALGALSLGGAAAAIGGFTVFGSSAAPAFAGWRAAPTTPAPGQLAQAASACGQGLGNPVITDSRGPYTASIYANSTTTDVCLTGNGVSLSARSRSAAPSSVAAGQIQPGGLGTRDTADDSLTLVDGRIGSGVTGVTVERTDGSSVQATVENGWYLAWWPGTVGPTKAEVTTASGTNTVAFPVAPTSVPPCPAGARCAAGYSYSGASGASGSESGSGSQRSTTIDQGGSASSSR